MLALRPYQVEDVARLRAAMAGGCKRLLFQSPTGSGKTVLVAHILRSAVERGKRAWFVVHRRELLDQAVQTLVSGADLWTGIVAAGHPPDPLAPVQVCSVGSMKRRLAALTPPDLLVWDECHHVPSASWSAIAAAMPRAYQLGLTATPQRLDGRGLGAYFDGMVQGPSVAALIADGYLSPYRLYAPASVDTSTMHRVAGDFNRSEVSSAMNGTTVVGDAVSHYQRHAEGGRALVFVWNLEASRALAAAFAAAGVPAAHVDGETHPHERANAMRAFRAGDLRVICNVDLFGEGLDVPAVDAVFLLRPTDSLGLYLQQCGRGLRPAPGKSAVRIFDHVGNWTRHGLPDDARTWSLDATRAKRGEREPTARRCPTCFAVSPMGATVCVACGLAFPMKRRKVAIVDGELKEADLSALRAQVRELERDCRTLHDWQELAKRMGYRPGWAWFRYQHRQARQRTPSTDMPDSSDTRDTL